MKFKVCIIISMLIIFSEVTNACMPFFKYNLNIGRYNGFTSGILPFEYGYKGKVDYVSLEGTEKVFPMDGKESLVPKNIKFYKSDADVMNYTVGDILLSLGDYPNGNYKEYQKLYHIGKLSCDDKGLFVLSDYIGTNDFGNIGRCGNSLLNDFDSKKSEKELLRKIKNKYKSCQGVSETLSYNEKKKKFYFFGKIIMMILSFSIGLFFLYKMKNRFKIN